MAGGPDDQFADPRRGPVNTQMIEGQKTGQNFRGTLRLARWRRRYRLFRKDRRQFIFLGKNSAASPRGARFGKAAHGA